jgi:hypothetical protein
VSALLRRLVRLWGQSRIRLPRRPAGPEEIGPGDRLQIGAAVWRVQGRLRLDAREGGGWMFRLEPAGEVPGEREARLVVPRGEGTWRLVVDGAERLLPPGCVIVFPASRGAALTNRGPTA